MSQLRIPVLAIAALLGLGMAVTAGAQRAQSAQEIVMRHCNAEANARHLMGASRQTFMRTCLRSPSRQHLALTSQQRRMRYCNAQARAKGLRGDDHRRFMSSCLRMR